MARRFLLNVSLALVLGGLAGPLSASVSPNQAAVEAVASPIVTSVQFDGRMNVRHETCMDVVTLKPGEPFSAERLAADRKALLELGYFRSVAAVQETTEGKTRITFRLAEWPRVTHIRVRGNTVLERRAIQEVISTQLGQVLCAPQLQDDIRAIEQLYRERGYVARISERLLDEATKSGILHFDVLEIQIAEVVVEEANPKLREACTRALAEIPPALYRPEAVSLDQQRLLRVRGVKSATPKVEPLEAGRVRIRWQINSEAAS